MKAFFARHEKNARIEERYRGEPWRDRGYVAWLLWGGDPGRRWAEKMVKKMQETKKRNPMKGVPGGSVRMCIKKMRRQKKARGYPRDPEALCAWIADQREPGWRSRPRKNREMIPGGKAAGMRPSDFDQTELARGTRHEMEHTTSRRVAREIAMDHLVEDPRYYRKLAKMEGKKNMSRTRTTTRRNPDVDKHAARELELFIDNDATIHWGQYVPIVKNLVKRKLSGTYDQAKAPKLFEYLMESGAKKYAKDFGGTWHKTFDVATRRAVARDYAKRFDDEYRTGEWDHVIKEVAPVAYRGMPGSQIRKLAAKKGGLPKVRSRSQAAELLLKNPKARSQAKTGPRRTAKASPKKNPGRLRQLARMTTV